jgi:superfamily II DNA or RNA helicase
MQTDNVDTSQSSQTQSFVELFTKLVNGGMTHTQISRYIFERTKALNLQVFVLKEEEPVLKHSSTLLLEEELVNGELAGEENGREQERRPTPSPELFSDDVLTNSVNEHPSSQNESIIEPGPPKLNMKNLAHLNNKFPALEDGRYCASEFQMAILNHMQTVREFYGHKIGAMVLATGLGKTILVILDIEHELQQIKNDTDSNLCIVEQSKIIKQCGIGTKPRLIIVRNPKRVRLDHAIEHTKQHQKPLFRFLFLVHSKPIRDEAVNKFKRHFTAAFKFPPSAFLSVEDAIIEDTSFDRAQFIFCLFQSFDRIPTHIVKSITHCVMDEVHHLVAHTYNRVYEILYSVKSLTYMLGMTATLTHRDDPNGDKLKNMFKGVLYIDLPWTVAKSLGCFPKVEYLECLDTLSDNRDIPTYAQLQKDFLNHHNNNVSYFLARLDKSLAQLDMATIEQVKKKLTPQYVVDMLLAYCIARRQSGQPPKNKILIFAHSCAKADQIAELINKQQQFPMKADSVHYKKGKKCDSLFERFRNGDLTVLVNVMMISEGVDMANIDCVVFSRLTESEIVFVQQMGRGLRKDGANDNKELTIIDLALNLRRRWKRLKDDLDKATLTELIRSFWDIDNFCALELEKFC